MRSFSTELLFVTWVCLMRGLVYLKISPRILGLKDIAAVLDG